MSIASVGNKDHTINFSNNTNIPPASGSPQKSTPVVSAVIPLQYQLQSHEEVHIRYFSDNTTTIPTSGAIQKFRPIISVTIPPRQQLQESYRSSQVISAVIPTQHHLQEPYRSPYQLFFQLYQHNINFRSHRENHTNCFSSNTTTIPTSGAIHKSTPIVPAVIPAQCQLQARTEIHTNYFSDDTTSIPTSGALPTKFYTSFSSNTTTLPTSGTPQKPTSVVSAVIPRQYQLQEHTQVYMSCFSSIAITTPTSGPYRSPHQLSQR